MAGQNKDTSKDGGKEGREGKERKKDDLARRVAEIAQELAALRTQVGTLGQGGAHADTHPAQDRAAPDAGDLTEADDALIARIGYALSSAPKVALARLLYTGGEQSAARLGEQAGLTTGSLYHHLRELMHAELVVQKNRTRYHLTERGRRALDALTPLGRDGGPA